MLSEGNEKSIQTIHNDFNKVIAGKKEEISRLIDHNQKLLLQIKKEKDKFQHNQQLEEENRYLQNKLLEFKNNMKSQEETTRNLKNDKYLIGSKLENIQERTSKPLGSKKEVEEKEANTNPVINTVKKEVNPAKEQTTKTPYRHPNYKRPFDQRQGQNEHK